MSNRTAGQACSNRSCMCQGSQSPPCNYSRCSTTCIHNRTRRRRIRFPNHRSTCMGCHRAAVHRYRCYRTDHHKGARRLHLHRRRNLRRPHRYNGHPRTCQVGHHRTGSFRRRHRRKVHRSARIRGKHNLRHPRQRTFRRRTRQAFHPCKRTPCCRRDQRIRRAPRDCSRGSRRRYTRPCARCSIRTACQAARDYPRGRYNREAVLHNRCSGRRGNSPRCHLCKCMGHRDSHHNRTRRRPCIRSRNRSKRPAIRRGNGTTPTWSRS